MLGSYVFWLIALVVAFIILWWFIGGKDYQFVGLTNYKPPSVAVPQAVTVKPQVPITPIVPRAPNINNPLVTKCDILSKAGCPRPKIKILPKAVVTPSTGSIGEKMCRQVLEEYYHKPFTRIRPKFLTNPATGRALELDCYNEELKIACEYNGIQHNIYPNWTGQTYKQFIDQLARDKFKADTCKRLGIYLIVVPHTIKHSDIRDFIIRYLPHNYHKRLEDGLTEFPTSAE